MDMKLIEAAAAPPAMGRAETVLSMTTGSVLTVVGSQAVSPQVPPPLDQPIVKQAMVSPPGKVSGTVLTNYPGPAERPTHHAAGGVQFDFNMGARVSVPPGEFTIKFLDLDTQTVVYESKTGNALASSRKKHFVRFRLEVKQGEEMLLRHDFDCRDKEVMIVLPAGTLGDSIGWLPYAIRFGDKHGCKLTIAIAAVLIPLFKDAYPLVDFVTQEEVMKSSLRTRLYATYYIGLFFEDDDNTWQPSDFRLVGLHRSAGHILNVDPTETPPKIKLPDDSRPIAEPYVVIATQASSQCKIWNNPFGWRDVIRSLKKRGYRVICIDKHAMTGSKLIWNHLPHGCEDETGDRPLVERARWLKHAEFFVGLSSGLSWLAWAMEVPVVMISGFTHPINEFQTPYRVFNTHVCNSCWNDIRCKFEHSNPLYCPRHANTARQFECTQAISALQVLRLVDAIPGVKLEPPLSKVQTA